VGRLRLGQQICENYHLFLTKIVVNICLVAGMCRLNINEYNIWIEVSPDPPVIVKFEA